MLFLLRSGMLKFRARMADDHLVVWLGVIGGLFAWLVLATAVALLIGGVIRLADRHAAGPAVEAHTTADLPGTVVAAPRTPVRRRRAVPLPRVGVALAATAVALETAGYAVRLTGADGPLARLLSMDDAFSLPRMFVALIFAAAAMAAVAGARAIPGRRTWWLAVGAVAAGIASVKAGSSVHADVVHLLDRLIGKGAAVLLSALGAAAVVGALWFLSRDERRDRRRVLGVLTLYAGASVGLSSLSSVVTGVYGGLSSWAAGATYVEETGEALAGVAFLVAVLLGVAPRYVLPAGWALRRDADAHGLELVQGLPGSTAEGTPAH